MKRIRIKIPVLLIFIGMSLLSLANLSCKNSENSKQGQETLKMPERLQLSHINPHLLETVSGTPVFLNNYTAWQLVKNGSREEIAEFISICKNQQFNMISFVLFTDNNKVPYINDTSVYGKLPFLFDSHGNPDPLRPDTTKGNNPKIPKEYDYWDHVDYLIDLAAMNGMYISLHPTWGKWVSGGYSGPGPDDQIVFNKTNAYKYGVWLGMRYAKKNNLLWMIGGDRSAIYELEDGMHDFREVWRAMAEGLADGSNGIDNQDGSADYSNLLISFHPRKWAPNSSEWFHNDEWLAFNSVQDTPYDQVVSIPYDYNLMPHKPSWLFEGR